MRGLAGRASPLTGQHSNRGAAFRRARWAVGSRGGGAATRGRRSREAHTGQADAGGARRERKTSSVTQHFPEIRRERDRKLVRMKKFSLSVGFVGLSLLATACGGSSDEPVPFGTSSDLAAKLAADLGCPFHVEVEPGRVFIAARGSSRVLAAPNEQGWVCCDEMQPFSATRCENGHIGVSPAQCGGEKHCRPVGGLVTNQAEMVSPTTLRCFNASE